MLAAEQADQIERSMTIGDQDFPHRGWAMNLRDA